MPTGSIRYVWYRYGVRGEGRHESVADALDAARHDLDDNEAGPYQLWDGDRLLIDGHEAFCAVLARCFPDGWGGPFVASAMPTQ